MSEELIPQVGTGAELPSPKQFRANFKEIFDSETTFGSTRAARMELLDAVKDIVQEYIKKDCKIVYIHARLKEAGYTGSRKELSEWLVDKGLWTKREVSEKCVKSDTIPDSDLGVDEAKKDASPINAQTQKNGPDLKIISAQAIKNEKMASTADPSAPIRKN